MKKHRLILMTIMLISGLFFNLKSVSAAEVEMETFCRYKIAGAHAGNAIMGAGTWLLNGISDLTNFLCDVTIDVNCNFYNKDQLSAGKLGNTIVDVVDKNGRAVIKATQSSKLYATFQDNITNEHFYRNGTFYCPSQIYAGFEGKDSKDYFIISIKTTDSSAWYNIFNWDITYTFKKIQGPSVRQVNPNDINISDVSCTGILGSFKYDLEGALKIMRFIAPIFVIVLGTYDYMGAIFSKDADLLKKANSRLTKRLILIVVLFFLPIILDIVLGIIDSSYVSCIH